MTTASLHAVPLVAHLMTSGDWHVYQHKDAKGRDVYALIGYPHQKTGSHKKRKDTYILVTIKKGLGVPFFLTFVAGEQLNQKSMVLFAFDKDQIKLLPQKDKALGASHEVDQKLIDHMGKHKILKVSSHFKKGEKTQDVYHLSGFKKAYQKLMSLMGV